MVKNKVSSFAVRLAFLFLVIPDFTIIDFLPDFISYIILLSVIGNAKNIVPHLAEAYDGLKKMIFISIIKIPAMIFMLSNMLLGRDIIPLMTFTFAALELIVLIPTVKHAFAGLYYIGERGDADENDEHVENVDENGEKEEKNDFDVIYKAAMSHISEILSLAAFIGSLVCAIIYKSGLMPLMENGLKSLKNAALKIKEATDKAECNNKESIVNISRKIDDGQCNRKR